MLLANSGLMSAGFFMLIPLLSVHLTRDLGYSGAAAGAVLALRQFTQQGLMLFGGALADRIGYRRVIAGGMLVRALGFFGFGLGDTLPIILVSAVVAALGGALFEATGKAALASLAPASERSRLFSLSAVAGGVGTTLGPLLGVALLPYSFQWVGIASGAFFFAAFALSAFLLPPLRGAPPGQRPVSLAETLRMVSRHRVFLVFTALLSGCTPPRGHGSGLGRHRALRPDPGERHALTHGQAVTGDRVAIVRESASVPLREVGVVPRQRKPA